MKSLITLLLLAPLFASSQFKVSLIIDKVPAQTSSDRIYISGNFNQWNPADPEAMLSKNSQGKYTKDFEGVEGGVYEFKFTLGSAESTECKSDGTEMTTRSVTINSDTVLHFTIARWKNSKNLNDSEKNGRGALQQLSSTTFLYPRIELYSQRMKLL